VCHPTHFDPIDSPTDPQGGTPRTAPRLPDAPRCTPSGIGDPAITAPVDCSRNTHTTNHRFVLHPATASRSGQSDRAVPILCGSEEMCPVVMVNRTRPSLDCDLSQASLSVVLSIRHSHKDLSLLTVLRTSNPFAYRGLKALFASPSLPFPSLGHFLFLIPLRVSPGVVGLIGAYAWIFSALANAPRQLPTRAAMLMSLWRPRSSFLVSRQRQARSDVL